MGKWVLWTFDVSTFQNRCRTVTPETRKGPERPGRECGFCRPLWFHCPQQTAAQLIMGIAKCISVRLEPSGTFRRRLFGSVFRTVRGGMWVSWTLGDVVREKPCRTAETEKFYVNTAVLFEANGGKWVLKTFEFFRRKINCRTRENGNQQLHFSFVSRAHKRNIQSVRRLFGTTNSVVSVLKAARDKGFRNVLESGFCGPSHLRTFENRRPARETRGESCVSHVSAACGTRNVGFVDFGRDVFGKQPPHNGKQTRNQSGF